MILHIIYSFSKPEMGFPTFSLREASETRKLFRQLLNLMSGATSRLVVKSSCKIIVKYKSGLDFNDFFYDAIFITWGRTKGCLVP